MHACIDVYVMTMIDGEISTTWHDWSTIKGIINILLEEFITKGDYLIILPICIILHGS